MTILTTLDDHSIKYLYALIPVSKDGAHKGAIDGQLHTNMVRGYIPSRITKPTFGYHLFRDLSMDECKTLQNRVLQGKDFVARENDILVCAIDTNEVCILDVDHPDYATHPFTQSLMQRSVYYCSLTKKFPKIFLRIDDTPFPSDNQLLAKLDGHVALELHTGRWSYCSVETEVYGKSILHLTYQELMDGYGLHRRSTSEVSSEHTYTDNEEVEEKEERFEKKLLKLLEMDAQWGVDYTNWVNMGFLLKHEFADADDVGRGLFHFYSSRLPTIRDAFGNVKNGYDYDECNAKWDSLFLRQDTLHINESFLDKLINHHKPLLQPSNTQFTETTPLQLQLEKILRNIPNLTETIPVTELRRFVKGIDEHAYSFYKFLLTDLYHVEHSDEGWGREEKEWRRARPTKKHTFDTLKAVLRSTNRACYESFFCSEDEKENYDLVKSDFEKYNFKLLSPPAYVYLQPTGNYEVLRSADFITKYAELKCNVWNDQTNRIERKAFVHLWMQDEGIRKYDRMVFVPSPAEYSPTVTRFYNGRMEICINTFMQLEFHDHLHEQDDPALLEDALAFFKRQLCADHDEFYEYMLKWMAFSLQKVGEKTRVVPIFKTTEGVGKTMFWDWFGKCVIGTKYYHTETDMNQLVGRFNSIVENKLFFVCNEIGFRDTKSEQNKLKKLISDYDISIERKGVDTKACNNHLNYVCTTNNDLPFAITPEDRRFTGIESKAPRLSTEDALKYSAIFAIGTPNSKLIATFARFLLGIDISNFDPVNDRVKTPFYEECIETLCPEIIQFLYYYTIDDKGRKYNCDIKRITLYEEYSTWNSKFCPNTSKMSLTAFGRRIKKIKGVIPGHRTYTLDLNVLFTEVYPAYSLESPVFFE